MPTKLSRYADGIMEAAWLAAVILVPVFFDIYSSRIFEPDKIAILRSLALIILLAWLVKLLEQGGVVWERLEGGKKSLALILRIPMVAPAVAMVVLYLLATLFSITPSVSLWGSYQRLQGTYTTLSYLVIFGAIAANLRKRNQVERLITVIILASLPVALYGILQKFKIDPVPWGGDTSVRIASNMGNSIFVAAYLIMVFPLTFGRIVTAFRDILKEESMLALPVIRATAYIFIAALQMVAIYLSQSRGPALGWMASSFILVLLLSLFWHKRWLTISTVAVAAALGVFLVVFNLEGGPLENLRKSPAIGRFGLLLDAESNSALVRKYIWEGAADLVSIHEPIEFPDGRRDRFNFLRPVLGYGPESMYVAYNPFYVPELAHVEKRNASPDRSHNETWDSLVITGGLGILVYLTVFVSAIFYGLKWTGFISNRRQRNLFFVLSIGGGVVGALGLSLWRGVEYFGVGMPFGTLIGLILYITEVAIFESYQPPEGAGETARNLTLIVLLAGIMAHFVEINFGIAIAVTRTYFWVFSALLLCVGYILPKYNQYESAAPVGVPVESGAQAGQKERGGATSKKRRGGREPVRPVGRGFWLFDRELMLPAILTGILISTLGYNFVTNSRGLEAPLAIIWSALTRLPNRNYALSYGILALVLTTWLVWTAVLTAEDTSARRLTPWLRSFGTVLGISLLIGLLFWLFHAGTLASIARVSAANLQDVLDQVRRYENLLSGFYGFIALTLVAAAYYLPEERFARLRRSSGLGVVAAGAGALVVLLIAAYTNLRVIQADIAFKLAEPFTRGDQWPVAIAIYNRANELAPTEDYYYLFLGRAYLEHAKTLTDANERESLISQAGLDLMKAQKINPLNTDHTANLARLYSLWASYESDPASKAEKAQSSDDYFARAVTLSPNSARIWDEWALLYLNLLGQPEQALERLNHALEIDPEYHWTYALLAEYHTRLSRATQDPEVQKQELAKAADYYAKALQLPAPGEPTAKYNYAISLGGLHSQLGQPADALTAYQRALELAPKNAEKWRIEETIANLYVQEGDAASALTHYQNALQLAPDAQKERLQTLISQLTQP